MRGIHQERCFLFAILWEPDTFQDLCIFPFDLMLKAEKKKRAEGAGDQLEGFERQFC